MMRDNHYKGLREVFVYDDKERFAWTMMQLYFRSRDEEPLENICAFLLYQFISDEVNKSENMNELRPLFYDFGERLYYAQYGVEIDMESSFEQNNKEIILEMCRKLMSLNPEEKAKDVCNKLLTDFSIEDIKECSDLITDIKKIVQEFIINVENYGKYEYVKEKID